MDKNYFYDSDNPIFQFPNGFSLQVLADAEGVSINFQFPNGFSLLVTLGNKSLSVIDSFNSLTDSHCHRLAAY